MEVEILHKVLELAQPFRIAHGVSQHRETVIVRLGSAFGEGPLVPYYPDRAEECVAWLQGLDWDTIIGGDPLALEAQIDRLPTGPAAAWCAVEVALHDRWAQHLEQPLYRLWGLSAARVPISTFTLGLMEAEADYREQLEAVAHLPLLKLKLGSGSIERDKTALRLAQEVTTATICVDANCAWNAADAARFINGMGKNCHYIEQPVAREGVEPWRELRALLQPGAPLLIADESVQTPEDLLALHGQIDGVNVKLLKTRGLRGARRLIAVARALGMQVMIGTMIESSIGCTAAVQLAPMADFVDLDSLLLVKSDIYRGARLQDGRVHLPEEAGLGIRLK